MSTPPRGFTLIEVLICAAIVAIILAVIAGAFLDKNRTTYVLDAEEWECTEHKTTTIMIPAHSRNTTTLIPSTITKCSEYRLQGDAR